MWESCSAARLALVLALGGALACSAAVTVAHAQSNPQQLAEANKKAMEEYNNLDIERAKASLEKAAKNAEKNGIRGPALARTLSNLAVVMVGGLGDSKGAISAFVRALREDPKVEPDPIVATPEVMSAYSNAKAIVAKSPPVSEAPDDGAEAAEPDAPPARAPTPARAARAAAPEPRVVTGPVEGNLDHTPVPEQLSQTAVPIYVRKGGDLDIQEIKVFYRSVGMKKPKSHEMTETDDGYTFLIPCVDVFEPKVEYFIVATDGDGNPVGNSGSSAHPIAVPIVAERTEPAPSLPGEIPPSQCKSDDECPPGMPGCGGAAGMGDSCSSPSDCQLGLTCEDDICVTGEREPEEEEEEDSSSSSKGGKKFFFEAAVGVGLTSVGKGRAPDRSAKPIIDPISAQSRDANGALNLDTAKKLLQAHGFDCVAQANDMNQLQLSSCAVAVHPGGFVPVPVINVAAGYNVTPKIAVALTGRFQIGRGEGPLAGILIGARGEYKLLRPAAKGLFFNGLAGLGVGQIQARPPAKGSLQGPYATNAKLGGIGFALNVGAKAGYRLSPNWGVNFIPLLNFGLPNFLFALDLTAGVDYQF